MRQKAKDSERATLKVEEAARIIGCGERKVREGVANGTIPSLRLGRNVLIPRIALLRWIENGGETA